MTCPKCNEPTRESVKFCTNCGFALAEYREEQDDYREAQSAPSSTESVQHDKSTQAAWEPAEVQPDDDEIEFSVSGFDRTLLVRVGAGLAVVCLLGLVLFALLAILQPTPKERLTQTLDAPPSEEILQELFMADRVLAEKVVEGFSSARQEAWREFLLGHAENLYEHSGAERFCDRMKFLNDLALWPTELAGAQQACDTYDEAAQRLSEIESQNSAARSEYSSKELAVSSAADDAELARAELRRIQDSLYLLDGWIHGRLGPNTLEVSEIVYGRPGGDRFVLRTTSSNFTTTGRFEMYVERGGETQVTLNNGRTVTWPVVVEADTTRLEIAKATLRAAISELQDAKDELRRTPEPDSVDTDPYERRLEEAQGEIATALVPPQKAQPDVSNSTGAEPAAHKPEAPSRKGPTGPMAKLTDDSQKREFLQRLCPQELSRDDGVDFCGECPSVLEGEPPLSVASVYVGSLSQKGVSEAVVATSGCAEGFNFMDGTVFMRLQQGKWEVVDAYENISTRECRAETLDEQRVLLCRTSTVGGGVAETSIAALVADDELHRTHLASLKNGEGACRYSGDFSETLDEMRVEDVDGDGREEIVLLLTIENGRYIYDRSVETACSDLDSGRVLATQRKEARAYQLDGASARPVELDPDEVTSATVRLYLQSDEGVTDLTDEQIEAMLEFESDSEAAWRVHRRRMAALAHAQQIDSLIRETGRLADIFPDHSESLYIELAEACEEAGKFTCAQDAYKVLLEENDPSARVRGRVAWFFATAPAPYRDVARATHLLAQAKKDNAFNGRAAIAQAEILLRRDKAKLAQQFLDEYLKDHNSTLAEEYLARVEEGDVKPRENPRDLVPKLVHKVPREWRSRVPEGPLTNAERLFAIELEAIDQRRRGNFEKAEALYWAALDRAAQEPVKMTFRMGIGKTYEAAGHYDRAFAVYEAMAREEPENPDILNRLAWSLLTTKSEPHQDTERGLRLAQKAAQLTARQDPSILDTVAEGLLAKGEKEKALKLLERCIELDPTRQYYERRLEKLQDDGVESH